MDNLMQNQDEMQEEELYALLDKALGAERLSVSEELIQKTLQRVAAEEDSKVISFEKAAKRKLPAVKYISVAAAALFVAVIGVGVLRGGDVSMDSAEMEAVYDNAGRKPGLLTADTAESGGLSVVDNADDVTQYYYSINSPGDMNAVAPEEEAVLQEDRGMSKSDDYNENLLEGTYVVLSSELAEALTAVGAEPVSGEAEYWEFVQREETWEKDLFRELAAAMDVFGEQLPEDGTYSYSLICGDGRTHLIKASYPLDGIVRLETEQGVLWGLLGEKARFYAE